MGQEFGQRTLCHHWLPALTHWALPSVSFHEGGGVGGALDFGLKSSGREVRAV